MIDRGAQFGIGGTPDSASVKPPPEQGRLDLTKKTSVGAPPSDQCSPRWRRRADAGPLCRWHLC
jgi:hypothetical protein